MLHLRSMEQAPPSAPGAWLLAASFAVLAAFAGWWGRGRVAEVEPAPAPAPVAAEQDLAPAEPAAPGVPDIVLVTVASLRADRVGPLWHDRPTMPWLSDLASRRGQAFRAVAPSTWSLPSAVSLLTGLPPSRHGVFARPRPAGTGQLEVPVLPEAVGTLAERLRRAGYQTRAVVADPALHRGTGLATGFHAFANVGAARAQRVQGFVERMGEERREVDKPLFAWIHYGDPVAPYQANPWVFWWSDGDEPADDAELPRLARLSPAELAVERDGARGAVGKLYDSELRLVDDQIQLLWGDLGLDDGDLVVVAGLHGEELFDHGAVGHGHALHEELVRVPLVLSWPERWPRAQRFAERVSLADVMPTLAEAGGAPFRVEGKVPARSLVPLVEGGAREASPVVAELGTRCRAAYSGSLKLVARGADVAVYDLDADPDERAPLPTDHAGAAALRAAFGRPDIAPATTVTVDLADAAVSQLVATVPAPGTCD